ncbi:Telomerase protein component 1 [Fasciola hepatica]|uniref:Telomerase protein component 1 n=1 Tax=Fasciola hepatica TaxID=6192 RepID=A0A4E0RWY5_FASHE|nr:Telomerase protein component 1 [Fasciola hepatica]
MVKRKPGMEGIDVMASHLTQNRMLQTSAHESSLSGLSMFRTVGASHKPLSLENTILSGNSLNQKTFYSQISTVEAPTKKQNAYQAEQKKPVADSTADTVLSENQKMARLASFSMESWSELASLNENEEYNEEMFVTSAVPTDWYDTNPPSLVDEKLLGQVDEARGTKANLLQFIASSLVDGGVLKRFDGRSALVDYLQVLSRRDPEFILKAMTTPDSDKISLSKPMRRNMIEKFTEFDYHQLAKHSKEKGRLKRAKQFCRSTASSSEPSDDSHPFIHMKRTCLTLKYLIRVLHIHAPTFPVMCLLGKRYPSSATEFVRLGLEGTWDPSLVGKRMKLPSPVTWETELSKNGNNAMTWSDLIKENKVPYMAMLRNLRNIIKSGLEPEYHDIVIKKLTNRNAVISSKLFPSRFFTAYVVLQELDRKLQFCSYLCRLRDRHFREKRKRGVVVGGKKGMKRKEAKYLDSIDNKDVVHPRFSEDTLEKYRDALNKAIGIAVRNNLPPIRGNTLIVCCFTVEGEKRKLTKQLKSTGMGNDIRAMGIVLASMCAQICECSTTYAILDDTDRCYAVSDYKQPEGAEYNILSQASTLLSQFKTFRSFSLADCLMEFNAIGYHFDTVYVIGDMCPTVAKFVAFQRAHVGSVNAVWSNLSGTDSWSADCGDKSGWLTMKGPTDQVLRYLSEASDKSLLDHVERIDELYGLVKPVRVQFPDKSITDNATAAVGIEVDRPVRMQWRYCRIFISSTFRDMHAERDLICGLLVPALRQYAAQTLRVHLLDVDLRWGVPESSTRSSQALEMCLDQAVKADLFVLLLGNRYGWSPDRALVNTLPGRLYQMLTKFYVLGMSITEMEYNMAKLAIQSGVPAKEKRLGPDAEREALRNRVFAFVRDPASLNGIPKEHALEFEETQDVKRTRLKAFKTTLQKDGVLVLNNYPSWFNGLIANRPVMGNLSVFGNELSRTLREAMNRLYKIEVSISPSLLCVFLCRY